MTRPLRKKALVTTALSVMLLAPGAALAQEGCIEVLGTLDFTADAAGLSGESPSQVDALIIGTRAGDAVGCVQSLEELQALLHGGAAAEGQMGELADEASAVQPAAGAETGAAVATAAGAEGAVEPDAETDAAAAAAVDTDVAPQPPLGNAAQMLANVPVGELEGDDVLTPEGEDAGTVEYFVVDTEGRVHVVVSLDDGILGIGDSERVIGLDQFDYNVEEEAFVMIQLTPEWLKTLPEFDSDTPGFVEIDDDAFVFTN